MEQIILNQFDHPYHHYSFLKCPQCANIINVSGSSKNPAYLEELKRNNFAAKCKHCTFDGVVVGSEAVHAVEFDATEFRRAAGR